MFSRACAADLNGANDFNLTIFPNLAKSATASWTWSNSCPMTSD